MDTSTPIPKKSRAKSCTSCRQVKLRCDMRDTYPAPCSRCRDRKQECRMDSSFKRVGARRQGEVSEDRLDGIQNLLPTFNHNILNPSPSSTMSASDTHPPTNHYESEAWLELQPQPLITTRFSESWSMGDTVIEYATARHLFEHFEEFYLPHIPILEPVTSFNGLYAASPLLFWAIIFTAAHHHLVYSELYGRMYVPYQKYFGEILTRPIQSMKDLHALLLICHWPFEVETQQEDPSWIHCGVAISTALYMGLNHPEDENLFGARLAKHSLQISTLKCRRMTWMKCFQISTQLSTWYGLQYSAPGIQSIAQFYDEKIIPGEFIAMTEIQRQVGRYTAALEGHASDGLAISLVPHFVHDFDAIKPQFSKAWSHAAEINLQAAKLYMFAICLISTDYNSLKSLKGTDAAVFHHNVLQWGHAAALILINLTEKLSVSKSNNPSCASYESGGCPLIAQPKHHFRLAFFACCFLFKYLDTGTASAVDRDSARNAISKFHQTFMRFSSQPQFVRAAAIIEVLGRAIVPNSGKLVTHVRNRLGASLMYNATWTAAELRGRRNDPKWSTTASASSQVDFNPSAMTTDGLYRNVDTQAESLNHDMSLEMPPNSSFEYQFPWGVWNDELFDALELGAGDQLYSDGSMPIYNLL